MRKHHMITNVNTNANNCWEGNINKNYNHLQDSYFLEMAGLYLHFVVQFAILILINIDFASASYHQIYTTFYK